MTLELRDLCQIDFILREPLTVGAGPSGLRLVYEVAEATVTGERLSGTLAGNSTGDWVTVVGTVGTVDVRAMLQTHDGALVLVQYRGRLDLAGGLGGPIYVAPLFETGDERYAWLNTVQAVGRGTLDGTALHYEWCEVR